MTERTDEGWPDEYRDPRDRPNPSVLRITVESFDEMREDTRAAVGAVEEGKEQPAVVSFRSVGELRKILTDRRIELLQVLVATESIAALAADLDRDYRTVHDDVTLLADYGLLFVVDDGQSRRPYLPYDRVHLDVELVGRHLDEGATAA
jgi:predicted transcriptional regulator